MNKRFLYILSFLTLLSSCKNETDSCGYAYFGGEIINPNNNFILLYNDLESTIDTITLDKNNRFSYKIDPLNAGLYSFVHGGEYQVVVLEPKDSIMIRLNTLDFDESLVFTGKGAKKNNFLIKLFVELESEEKELYNLSKKEPLVFQAKLDSLKQEKLDKLSNFKEEKVCSDMFETVANASINYNYHTHKELYPFRHYGRYNLHQYENLPDDFYDYRPGINYNKDQFQDYFPYYNFLIPHFDNLALPAYYENSKDTVFNRNDIAYNLHKLELMNTLVKNEVVKNNLLKYSTRNYLSNANSMEDCEAMFNSYIEKSTNDEHNEQIKHLFSTLNNLQPGHHIPDVELLNHKNEVVSLSKVIDKPTVVFFWTKAIKNHFINSHKKVERLKQDYPDINFISININSSSYPIWKRHLMQQNISIENEYRFRNPDFAKKALAIHYINKVMVIGENKRIISSNASLFTKDFRVLLNDIE